MNSSLRGYLMVSIAVFALIALVQVVRALAGFPVQIGSFLIPVVASWLLAIVAGALAFWGIRLLRRG